MQGSAEQRTLFRLVSENEFAHLIDGVNAIQVAIALRRSPGEQPVAAEDETLRFGIVFDGSLNQERQLESGTLPRHPHDFAIEFLVEFLQLLLPVGACREGDGPNGRNACRGVSIEAATRLSPNAESG